MMRLSLWLLLCGTLAAQTVQITDTIKLPTNEVVAGSCVIQLVRGPATPPSGNALSPAKITVRFTATAGGFSVALLPTDTLIPSGQHYHAVFSVSSQTVNGRVVPFSTWEENWLVPTVAGPLTLGDIRTTAIPVPSGSIPLSQLSTAGAAYGNAPCFDGTSFAAGNCTTRALSAPAAPTVTQVGTPGSSTYKYAIIAVTAAGGIMGASTTTTTGNATLNNSNFNRVAIPAVTGATGCQIYRFLDGQGATYGNGPLADINGTFVETYACGTTVDDVGQNGWFFTDFDWAVGPSHSAGIAAPAFASTGAGVGSEQFGFMANAYGSEAVAFGWGASAYSNGIAIGPNSVAGIAGTTIGYNSHADNGGINIGSSSQSGGQGICIGATCTALTGGIGIGGNVHPASDQVWIARSFIPEIYFAWNGGSNKAQGKLHAAGLQLETLAARPTCDATTRGLMWVEKGTGASGADLPILCIQTSSTGPTFAWVGITVAP